MSIERKDVNLTPNFDDLFKNIITDSNLDEKTIALLKGNLKSRLRMSTLYSIAQSKGYLVLGTSNKSEYHLGYFTKHGDSAADIQPLIQLTKKDVYKLAIELDLPEEVINAIPSADL
jgi:NAD+ synthase